MSYGQNLPNKGVNPCTRARALIAQLPTFSMMPSLIEVKDS
jgi:hypothetical protein